MEKSQEIVVFNSSQSDSEFQIILDGDNETVWITEKQIIELFGKARRTIGEHINNLYEEGELDKSSTWREFRQVQKEGQATGAPSETVVRVRRDPFIWFARRTSSRLRMRKVLYT